MCFAIVLHSLSVLLSSFAVFNSSLPCVCLVFVCLQEVHRAISVAIVTPTPSGATSHLLTYATGLYSANTTSILSLRLPGAVATALTHPMCAPLALPIHAVDDAARLAIAKACAAAVEATVEVNAVPMLAPQMAVSGASPAPPISASLAGLSSVATPVPTAPADSSSFSVLAADQPVVSAISEATAPVAAAQSEHVSAPATGLAGGFTGVSLSFPSFTVKGGPTVSKRQRDAAPDDDEDDMEFPALIAGDPEE